MFSFNDTSDFVKDYKALNLNLAKVTFFASVILHNFGHQIIPFKPPHILYTLSIILVTDDASLTF